MIFELAQDFRDALAAMPREHPKHRMLELFEEAIRRDSHFIARHPTTLFQCMWNTAWWYDCPEVAKHYAKTDDRWPDDRSVRRGLQPPLCTFMEAWRDNRNSIRQAAWMRSLRPPVVPLGACQALALRGHEQAVDAVKFFEDGRRVASTSLDGTVRVWDTGTGRQLQCFNTPHTSPGAIAVFPDGLRIATGSRDGTVCIWSAQSAGEVLRLRMNNIDNDVLTVAVSPDGSRVAGGTSSGTVVIFDTRTSREVCRCVHPEQTLLSLGGTADTAIECIAYSPDGCRVATGSTDETVRIWDANSGCESHRIQGHRGAVTAVAFSPDGRRIVSVSAGRVRVWDARSGQVKRSTGWLRGSFLSLLCLYSRLEFAIKSRMAVREWRRISSPRRPVRIEIRRRECDAFVGQSVALWSSIATSDKVFLSPEGAYVICGRNRWDRESGHSLPDMFTPGELVACSSDNRLLACVSGNTVWLLEADPGWKPKLPGASTDGDSCLVFSQDGRFIASGSSGGVVRVWNSETAEIIQDLKTPRLSVTSLAFAPGAGRVAAGFFNTVLGVWQVATGEPIWIDAQACGDQGSGVVGLLFSLDGSQVISESYDNILAKDNVANMYSNTIYVRDAATGLRKRTSDDGRSAFKTSSPRVPFHVSARTLETVVDATATSETVAWYPTPFREIVIHPTRPTWAVTSEEGLNVIALEDLP